MKILIAEDEQSLRIIIRKLMEKWGFEFDIVSNGHEAVKKSIENDGRYDLCLMNIDMPVMNGLEATEIIRQNTRYFPIIAITGYTNLSEKYNKYGMDAIIKKPFNSTDLKNKITEYIYT